MATKTRAYDLPFTDMGGAALEQFSVSEKQQLEFKNAKRVQQSFLTKGEKKALLWLAKHVPAWVNSDHLTGLGFVPSSWLASLMRCAGAASTG